MGRTHDKLMLGAARRGNVGRIRACSRRVPT